MNKNLKIVGIGASASGLQALEMFFSNCPTNSGLSFVVIQHLAPDHEPMYASLLKRKTAIPISMAEESTAMEPDHIYLIPANKNIILSKDRLKLVDRAPAHELNLPIDLFLTSLAADKKENAVGVILSGTGSDGTRGAAAIKETGGVVLVQDTRESGFSGMPQSVISAGHADFVLSAARMPGELMSYFNYSEKTSKREENRLVDSILEIIKKETKYDFTAYRRQTLNRRIVKRKNINKLESIAAYRDYLEKNDQEQDILVNEFLIGVTRFFRDKAHFKTLKEQVIPQIIAGKEKGETIKLWVIGCVTGEEAYSLAILLKENLVENPKKLNFKIFATDISLPAIEKASKGQFGLDIRFDVEPDYLSKYFKREENRFTVQPHLRKHIVFSHHDILHNPPFNKMDLISCRNLLIYFQDSAQEKTIKNILYALNTNGYLFLGASESLGSFARNFEVIDHRGKIFKKITEYDGTNTSYELFNTRVERMPAKKLPEFASELTVQVAKQLALVTNSVCICVNEHFQILEVYGSLRLIGSLPFEGFSTNLLKLLPKEFHVPIATAIRSLSKASPESETITKVTNFKSQDKTYAAKLIFDRFDQRTYPHEKFYLVAIKVDEFPADQIVQPAIDVQSASNLEIQQLQSLLEEANENLQLTIEELESSNEEAQATNEELVSSNEELQSTNEELQSVNEELYTVNAELQEKNIQLMELNADIENLINSSPIASLFLDERLHIRRFTPSLRNIINLWDADIGRSITNFSLPDKHFLNDVKSVIESNETHRKKVTVNNDQSYLQEIHAYVQSDERKKGVVVNYTNITDLNEAYHELESKSKFLNEVLESFPGNFFIYDLEEQKMVLFNQSLSTLLGYSPEELKNMGHKVIATIFYSMDMEKVKRYHEKMKKAKAEDIFRRQVKLQTKNNESRRMFSIERPFEINEQGTVKSILCFLTGMETNTAEASEEAD